MYSSLTPGELVQQCATAGNPQAWEEFIARFNPVIKSTVYRTLRRWSQPSPEMIQDLVQEVYLQLCANDYKCLKMLGAAEPEKHRGYMAVLSANTVSDYFKARNAKKRGAGQVVESVEEREVEAGSGSLGGEERIDWEIRMREIDAALERAGFSERDRTIFWLYYRQGLTAAEIALLPALGLTVKGVESLLGRMCRELRGGFLQGASS